MEEKNLRELSMDEMEKISGGASTHRDANGHLILDELCPDCGGELVVAFANAGLYHAACKLCKHRFIWKS